MGDARWFNIDTMRYDLLPAEPLAEKSKRHNPIDEQVRSAAVGKKMNDKNNLYHYPEDENDATS